ncbi:MAG: DNA mismatch repair protein MutS [Bacteroidetes bacterium]|nr:DNA mismatch repair protein MutS [Bacteroidota bacterium]
MHQPANKTREDLEFDVLLIQVQKLCKTDLGQNRVAQLQPIYNETLLRETLQQTLEFTASFKGDNRIPSHEFESVTAALKHLQIENFTLEVKAFQKIASLCKTTNDLVKFFNDYQTFYEAMHRLAKPEFYDKEIIANIEQVIDKFGEVKDSASENLSQIRKRKNVVLGQINQSFNAALSKYAASGWLDDIRESVVDSRRVLAVQAMHKKQVKGRILGTSKTGSIIFMEPEATFAYTNELNNLIFEESEEVRKILTALTHQLRPYADFLEEIQTFLTEVDVIYAKARYAQKTRSVLPEINREMRVRLIDAFHPLLYLSNLEKKAVTYPQTFELDSDKRILVISGPNAGGKSITLKTLGLLQMMLQSGMLIPVHPQSTTCLFREILTDIGDNQSIENHLSTYSYRLKNMRRFLRRCQADTLFLIDEFGSGTDPELGGALAETFLEEFYHRKAYGIITTHYANLKLLANEMPHMTNANMLFDHQSLEPIFKLQMGEAGSSYTFEVAQKNGIPFSLINRAKKKVERGKVRFDKSIVNLQKERSRYVAEKEKLEEASKMQHDLAQENLEVNRRIREKLERYQVLYDNNQKAIYLGNKLKELSDDYAKNKNKKQLLGALLKIVEVENAKKEPTKHAPKLTVTEKKQALKKPTDAEVIAEIAPEIEKIRARKKKEREKKQKTEKEMPTIPTKVGDRVRLPSGKAVGSIDRIEKNMATVNYGAFTTKVKLDQLELVEKKKS